MDFSKIKLSFFCLILMGFSVTSYAAGRAPAMRRAFSESQILHVTSDAMPGYLDLALELNDDQVVTGLHYSTSDGETKTFDISNIKQGIVLLNRSGHNVVTIQSPDFDPAHGGSINVVYLMNGIFNTYGTFPLEMNRIGDGWELEVNDQAGRRKISNMFLKKNTAFGQIVGISKIIVN